MKDEKKEERKEKNEEVEGMEDGRRREEKREREREWGVGKWRNRENNNAGERIRITILMQGSENPIRNECCVGSDWGG